MCGACFTFLFISCVVPAALWNTNTLAHGNVVGNVCIEMLSAMGRGTLLDGKGENVVLSYSR